MKALIVDLALCNGCYGCQIACKDEMVENEWAPYSKPQPNTGHFWVKMLEKVHGQVPKVRVEYRPQFCRHCTGDAPCMAAAPEAVYRRDDGLIIIDPEKAKGNRALADACPYGAIYWNEELDIAQKCTGCAHLVDKGEEPHCVEACATGALRFGEEEDFADEIANETHEFDIEGTGSLIHYVNPFGLFISGEVWSSEDDLIIEGAQVKLTDSEGNIRTAETDGFGDFWFKQLAPGNYVLDIDADGFDGVSGKEIQLEESLNIGDFPLPKK